MKRLVLPILMLWLAGIAVAASVLAAGPTLLPAIPLQASASDPLPSPAADAPGIIAYVRRSTHDIHLISPDGNGDRVLWTAPQPLAQVAALDLAWRPDGRELAFSSEHEAACSVFQSDVYAIDYDGAGYRRVTNSPACAALAGRPKGSVALNVTNYTSSLIQAYVQGAPGVQTVFSSGTVTFNNVADLGPGVFQPAVGIYGGYRVMSSPPFADVQPNVTVPGGNLLVTTYSGIDAFGAGKVSWKGDGSALAYGMRTYSRISQIPATPPYGSIGEALPVVAHAAPNLVAWGPTAATRDQYLYFSKDDPIIENIEGIYLNTAGNASGGTKLVPISAYYGAETVYDIEWLPDGSGFLFTKRYNDLGTFTDIFEYNFTTEKITRLMHLPDDQAARGFSISPDGQQIVFEWVTEVWDPTSSLWIVNRDGSGLHKLADDAGRPAWGKVSAPPAPTATPTATASRTPTATATATRPPGPTATRTPTATRIEGAKSVYLPLVLKIFGLVPAAPALNAIENADGDGNYTVSWNASASATGYLLQEDDNGAFSSPKTRYSGASTSWNAAGQAAGAYTYRVRASNAWGASAWSNPASVIVAPQANNGINGRVTYKGAAAPGLELQLRFFDGAETTTAATTTTDSAGRYRFTGAASLGSGQGYWVRFLSPDNPLWVSVWETPAITAYTSDSTMPGGDFDIANVILLSPPDGAAQALPVTLTWQQRSITSDTYRVVFFDLDTGDYWYTADLGNVGSFTATSLWPDAVFGKEYGWVVWVFNGPDSYGESYTYRTITFLSGMARSLAAPEEWQLGEGLKEPGLMGTQP